MENTQFKSSRPGKRNAFERKGLISMKMIILGKTGLEISSVTYGGMVSNGVEQSLSDQHVSYAYDRGINYFDVAPLYGDAQTKMGNSIRPYRKDIILACKTFEREAKTARAELEESLRLLHTDYFDVYQLHCLFSPEDVENAFSENGSMKTILEAQKQGYIRHVGITAHCEESALKALELYDFDTVLFPLNWATGLKKEFGHRVAKLCKEQNKGLISMKSQAKRVWNEGEEKTYPLSWTKPIDDDDRLAICALKYALSLGADTIIPPGNFEHFSFVLENIDECLKNPLTKEDLSYLKQCLENLDGEPIF